DSGMPLPAPRNLKSLWNWLCLLRHQAFIASNPAKTNVRNVVVSGKSGLIRNSQFSDIGRVIAVLATPL
ncbi:MAG: hypothetical protein AB7F98_15575, partial [Novosphingobium sp.]